MQKKGCSCSCSCRAWNLLRLALKWARKGAGEPRRALMMDIRKFFKGIARRSDPAADSLSFRRYGEREMSFDATPIVHVKMYRPRHSVTIFNIPCIKPSNVRKHFDYDDDLDDEQDCGRLSLFKEEDDPENWGYFDDDDEIDVKAEQFITRFYQQMKIENK